MENEKLKNNYEHLNKRLNHVLNICTDTTKSLNQTFEQEYEKLIKQCSSLKKIVIDLNVDNKTCPSKLKQESPNIYKICPDGSLHMNTSDSDSKKIIPKCTKTIPNPNTYRTCLELLNAGYNQSGIYNITPTPNYIKTVYCDQESANGGWIGMFMPIMVHFL